MATWTPTAAGRGQKKARKRPGNEGLPATRASRQRGPPGKEGFSATRASRQRVSPGNDGLRPGSLEIEAGFCHVKFCHKIKDLEHILGRSWGGTLFQDVAPTNGHMDPHSCRKRPPGKGPATRASRQRGPPDNEGLPATTVSRQRELPGNEGLPATRASRLPARRTSRQRGPPGNEGLPATRASGNEGLPATRASRQRGLPGNEGLPATRASRQQGLPTRAPRQRGPPGNEGLPATRASRHRPGSEAHLNPRNRGRILPR